MIWIATALALDGRVQVKGSGDPVSDAVLTAPDGTEARTDEDGWFTLAWTGTGDLQVLADGFVGTTVPVDGQDDVYIFVVRDPGYEIVVEAFRPTSHATRHVVDAEMAEETPGNLEDAVRLVQSLPGVAITREYSPGAGTLSVRGSTPGDNRYLLDGIEVPYLYHFNQYASVFPASQVGTLELFPSTFGASYGDAVGAIVDTRSNTEAPEALHGSAMLNFVMGGADLRTPVGGDWWVSASGRRSYQDLAGEQTEQFSLWPVFHDYVLRAEHPRGGVFLWGAGDSWDRKIAELDVVDAVDGAESRVLAFRRGFQVGGGRHRWDTGRTVVAAVRDHTGANLTGRGRQDFDSLRLTNRLDDHRPVSDATSVAYGWELHAEWASLAVRDAGPDGLLVAEEAPAIARGVDVQEPLLRRRQGGVYGELHHTLGDVRVMPGVRVELDGTGPTALPDPRLAARWHVAEQTELKVAGGRYHQRPSTDLLIADPDLATTRSWQVGGGIEQTVANRLELHVDAYRKWLNDALYLPLDAPPIIAPIGDAWGVELTTRYRLREVFFLWGWIGYQRSFVDLGYKAPSDGDQPVALGMVASWDPGKGWNLGLRYRYGAGLPFTNIRGSIYDATNDAWLPQPGQPNGDRLPAYQKVDIRVAKTWTFDRWSLTGSLEVWYVPPTAAQLYPTWSFDFRRQGWVVGPTVLPLAGVRASF